MAATTPLNPNGAFKSLWGKLLGLATGDSHSHLYAEGSNGTNGKVIASTRPDLTTIVAGSNGAGAITLTSVASGAAKVGDIVECVLLLSGTPADSSASFETTISVAGQLQQTSASNLSANQYLVRVKPQS